MAYHYKALDSVVTERRGSVRSRAAGEARLQTASGSWHGELWDLSETGARAQVENPPAAGLTVLLKWQSHDRFCRVVWSTGDMCGLVFDQPIPAEVVHEVSGPQDGPRLSVNNIPLGQKRSRP